MLINMFPMGASSRRFQVSKLSEQRIAHHFLYVVLLVTLNELL